LFWKFVPAYVLVGFAGALMAGVLLAQSARNELLRRVDRDLEQRAALLARPVAEMIERSDAAALDAWCKALGAETGGRFTAIAADGSVLADSYESPGAMANLGNADEVAAARARGSGYATRFSQAMNQPFRYHARAVESGVVVRAGTSLRAVNEAMLALYGRLALGLIGAAAIAVLASWIVARDLRGTIRPLIAGARRFASGDFRKLNGEPAPVEFASLTQALNQMAEQLDERFYRETEQRSERDAILESMAEGVVAVDSHQRIISVNRAAARLLQVDVASVQGLPLIEVIRNSDLENFARIALESDLPLQTEIVLHQHENRSLEVKGAMLRNARGVSMGAVLVLNDVTRLRKLERVRRDFVSNVSHELRTPLTAIKGFVETLQHSALESPDDARRFLGLVAKHVNRLNAIIEDLTSLSRIEQGEQKDNLAFTRCNLRPIVDNAVQVCDAAAAARGIRIDVSCDNELFVRANAALLEQCFVNLLDNAIKYSPNGRRVQVVARAAGGDVQIAVTDEGIGIPKEHHERIFERFYRVDQGRSRDAGGTGLGLSIVRHIVQLHQGRIELDSRVGAGSTFRVSIPAARPALARAAVSAD
jgi:two-component system phosphate regulon sensor histidine kinase PhoR